MTSSIKEILKHENSLIEIAGHTEMNKSKIAQALCSKVKPSLYVNTSRNKVYDNTIDYYIETNSLDDIGPLTKYMKLVIIDDIFFINAKYKKIVYAIKEWLYNNPELNVVIINQLRHKIGLNDTNEFVPYMDYLLRSYSDVRYIASLQIKGNKFKYGLDRIK